MGRQENQLLLQELITRSKEPYYQFCPYFKRGTTDPSWQWDFVCAGGDPEIKGRVALGGNRIGKSEMGAYECNLAIANEHPFRKYPDSGIGWVVGLDFNMIRQPDLPLFEKFFPQHRRQGKSKFYSQDKMWHVHSDKGEWLVYFKSSDSGREKFQATKVDWIWFDEEPKKTDIFQECERGLIDNRGVWWMTATPVLGTAWLKALSEREDVFSCTGGMLDNPYLPIEEVQKFGRTLTEEEYDVRILGLYVLFGGKPVFKQRVLNLMLADIEKETPATTGIIKNYKVA